MGTGVQKWVRVSLINLMIVALLGVVMRYKIGFDFPYFSQKYIQHAHSHFAFAGWVMQSIYVLMVAFISEGTPQCSLNKYRRLLGINLVCSYGMLISFFVSGYSFLSIALSTLTIVNNGFFAYFLFADIKMHEPHPATAWFKTAIWFNLISSAGTFYLAYMMASRNFNEHWYLASVYFYLHFQYNGFFTFACMGLAIYMLMNLLPGLHISRWIFRLLFASCIPAFFLSTLWADLPVWLYVIVVIAAFVQVVAWLWFAGSVIKAVRITDGIKGFGKFMLLFVAAAFTVKLLLQLGSTVPEISKLAFGFRPVVIAYLHLVLLAVISCFLLAYFYISGHVQITSRTTFAFALFLAGVFLNEVVLGAQGIASFSYIPIRYVNEILFCIAVLLAVGAILMLLSQRKTSGPKT